MTLIDELAEFFGVTREEATAAIEQSVEGETECQN